MCAWTFASGWLSAVQVVTLWGPLPPADFCVMEIVAGGEQMLPRFPRNLLQQLQCSLKIDLLEKSL